MLINPYLAYYLSSEGRFGIIYAMLDIQWVCTDNDLQWEADRVSSHLYRRH